MKIIEIFLVSLFPCSFSAQHYLLVIKGPHCPLTPHRLCLCWFLVLKGNETNLSISCFFVFHLNHTSGGSTEIKCNQQNKNSVAWRKYIANDDMYLFMSMQNCVYWLSESMSGVCPLGGTVLHGSAVIGFGSCVISVYLPLTLENSSSAVQV